MTSKFLQIFKPFVSIVPEVKKPARTFSHQERIRWTLLAFVAYAIMSSIPIIGGYIGEADPFHFLRVITASTYGTLTELGISAILSGGLFLLVLRGLNILKINQEDPEEKALYNCAFKVLAILITIIEASLLLIGGTFGTDLPLISRLAVLLQLVVAGVVIIYLDEIITKGWGYGSGIALFIVGGVALQIFTGLFAVQVLIEGSSMVLSNRGIILAFLSWITTEGFPEAIGMLFFRYSPDPDHNLNLPSLSIFTLINTIVFIFLFNYIGALKIRANNRNNNEGEIPSNSMIDIMNRLTIPVLFAYTLFANVFFVAEFVWNVSGREGTTNVLANILGTFTLDAASEQLVPTGGVILFLTPPQSLIAAVLTDPIGAVFQCLTYGILFVITVLFFLVIMTRIEGGNLIGDGKKLFSHGFSELPEPAGIKDNNTSQKVIIPGFLVHWGIFIASIIVIGDLLGVLGSSVGLFLCVSFLKQYFAIKTEKRA